MVYRTACYDSDSDSPAAGYFADSTRQSHPDSHRDAGDAACRRVGRTSDAHCQAKRTLDTAGQTVFSPLFHYFTRRRRAD